MVITLTVLLIALVFALFLVKYASRTGGPQTAEELERRLEPVSMPALMNLIDPRNLEFLEKSLPSAEYRTARQQRTRILRSYVRRIAHNARLLIALAETAQRAPDPSVAQSGRVLMDASLATRGLAMRALASLYIGEWFPGMVPDLAEAVRSYQSAASRADSLHSLNAAR